MKSIAQAGLDGLMYAAIAGVIGLAVGMLIRWI